MTTPRQERLTPDELALKLATDAGVKAAGGQVFIAQQIGRAQSVVSDWCSLTTRSFIPLHVAARVDALGTGSPGHPHIARALARAQSGAFVQCVGLFSISAPTLGEWLGEVAGETGELIAALSRGDLAEPVAAIAPARRVAISEELNEAIEELAALRSAIDST